MGLWHARSVVHNDFGRMALGIYVVMVRLKDGCAEAVDIGFLKMGPKDPYKNLQTGL
jgi:hypothetical protein